MIPRRPVRAGAVLLALAAALCPAAAWAQAKPIPGPPIYAVLQNLYAHITTDATTVVKSGPGVLHTICVNTPAATETLTLYDNTAASGTEIGVITEYASAPSCFTYDIVFNTGLTIVSATAAGDVTVTYQ